MSTRTPQTKANAIFQRKSVDTWRNTVDFVTEGRRLYGIPKPPSMLREEKKAKNSLDN